MGDCGARLLALLALREGRITRCGTAGTLWPETSDEHAQSSLRSALRRLPVAARRAVHVTGHDLSLAAGVEVDLHEHRSLAYRLLDPSWRRGPTTSGARRRTSSRPICCPTGTRTGSAPRPTRGDSCASTPSRRSRAASCRHAASARRPPPPRLPRAPIRCARALARRSSGSTSPRATSPMRLKSSIATAASFGPSSTSSRRRCCGTSCAISLPRRTVDSRSRPRHAGVTAPVGGSLHGNAGPRPGVVGVSARSSGRSAVALVATMLSLDGLSPSPPRRTGDPPPTRPSSRPGTTSLSAR